ncbi:hypothetical protein CPC735_034640 [Coccidioides posadasii C735 delta SOWgp]|uniref:Uncharacterized protein n=1 Tax=Coccidioides posadasii (strain C735) TaxID=222929 RepID=C5P5Y8_COCP7|nr:hypothetical protein CPC735_034640 [Coccidioides posadasii C735 delta SOWgp]EER28128.1 hypothetical protein CPC735_034640 [Coccidioides posadasii C735 delta SOWgp]|eukprot:XP_003070273.1 hypothetical protein CPC735_034640 [Coccidioides posadasii C735 delta SOWgp]
MQCDSTRTSIYVAPIENPAISEPEAATATINGNPNRSLDFVCVATSNINVHTSLTSDISRKGPPSSLLNRKDGEIHLSKRNSSRDVTRSSTRRPKSRSPSVSSSRSSSSVSTISTNRSRSSPPKRRHDLSPSPFRTDERKRKARSSSSESYFSSDSDAETHSRSRETDRRIRRKWKSQSPSERGRRCDPRRRRSWRGRSDSRSMDRSRIARERRSVTPSANQNGPSTWNEPSPVQGYRKPSPGSSPSRSRIRRRMRSPAKDRRGDDDTMRREAPQPERRSLSPYSKRLALTQAMNMRT